MENGTVALLTGAPEHQGTRGIRPYHVLTAALTQFQSKGADYAPKIGLSPVILKSFRRPCLRKCNGDHNDHNLPRTL